MYADHVIIRIAAQDGGYTLDFNNVLCVSKEKFASF